MNNATQSGGGSYTEKVNGTTYEYIHIYDVPVKFWNAVDVKTTETVASDRTLSGLRDTLRAFGRNQSAAVPNPAGRFGDKLPTFPRARNADDLTQVGEDVIAQGTYNDDEADEIAQMHDDLIAQGID